MRSALLIALLEGPGHGCELMQALRPGPAAAGASAGSVYPSLQLLADEGLVTVAESEGKRVFALTDSGRREAGERVARRGFPWEAMDRGRPEQGGLRIAVRNLHIAAKQVGVSGSSDAVLRATEVVAQGRRDLYRALADL